MSLSIPIVATMSPKADVVVFYERNDGEVVADSMSLSVEGTFDNQVRSEQRPRERHAQRPRERHVMFGIVG